ncbi:MAG: class I SAM-dependent methyltransferase, partial [Thermodesulfobacteriota bacterium]
MGIYNSFLGKKRILQFMANHPASRVALPNRILNIGRRWGFLYIRIFGYPPVVSSRLLARKILCFLKKKERGLLLDVGCSLGTYSFELARLGFTVVGIDVNRESINLAEKIQVLLGIKNVTFWEMNILSNNFPEHTFKVIIALETLEHIKEDSKAIQEFNRILKNDGFLIISVPFREKVEEYDEPRGACRAKNGSLICVGEGGGHFRNGYNLRRMKTLLENNGFRIIDYEYICIPRLLNASILSFPFKYPLSLFFSPLS